MSASEQTSPSLTPRATSLTVAVIAAAIWANLPELALINLELWATVVTAVWAFSSLTHFGQIGLWGFGLVFGLPALWGTAQTVRLALNGHSSSAEG